MKNYFQGYYCRDDLHLQVINKDSNRKILEALREAYPSGLSVEELSKVTKLPIKTVYTQKAELYREYFINHFEEVEADKKLRGRPSKTEQPLPLRNRTRVVIEELFGIYDIYKGNKPVPLPPGHNIYSDGFKEALDKITLDEEKHEMFVSMLKYIKKIYSRSYDDDKISKEWAPNKESNYCCSQCGLNHEARDFFRAVLMNLLDEFEQSKPFMDFLKDENMITQQSYERM
ncbi:MAG: hypothetical protein AB7U98_12205 [Candidatus Nitrosocosmicus sp.]